MTLKLVEYFFFFFKSKSPKTKNIFFKYHQIKEGGKNLNWGSYDIYDETIP